MLPIVTNVAAPSVGWSVCWSVMIVSPAKRAEGIKMQFYLRHGLRCTQGTTY